MSPKGSQADTTSVVVKLLRDKFSEERGRERERKRDNIKLKPRASGEKTLRDSCNFLRV